LENNTQPQNTDRNTKLFS